MIDNFTLISAIISTKQLSTGDFFFLEIISRKKDNPDQKSHARVIKDYYIKDANHLLELRSEIIALCNVFNARAYFRLNKRNKKTVALKTLALLAENISTEQYDVRNCYNSCCGTYHSDLEKTWVIDFDFDKNDEEALLDMQAKSIFIVELIGKTLREPIVYFIPTKNGMHLICPPFNVAEYKEKYSELSYHKDNPTILYVPINN